MVNYIILYKKFVEHHVIKLILLKISKLSARLTIGGPKMSGNFVRERQRIVYIYNIHILYMCILYM